MVLSPRSVAIDHCMQRTLHFGLRQQCAEAYCPLLAGKEVEIVVGEVVRRIVVNAKEDATGIAVRTNGDLIRRTSVICFSLSGFQLRRDSCGLELQVLGIDKDIVVGVRGLLLAGGRELSVDDGFFTRCPGGLKQLVNGNLPYVS